MVLGCSVGFDCLFESFCACIFPAFSLPIFFSFYCKLGWIVSTSRMVLKVLWSNDGAVSLTYVVVRHLHVCNVFSLDVRLWILWVSYAFLGIFFIFKLLFQIQYHSHDKKKFLQNLIIYIYFKIIYLKYFYIYKI